MATYDININEKELNSNESDTIFIFDEELDDMIYFLYETIINKDETFELLLEYIYKFKEYILNWKALNLRYNMDYYSLKLNKNNIIDTLTYDNFFVIRTVEYECILSSNYKNIYFIKEDLVNNNSKKTENKNSILNHFKIENNKVIHKKDIIKNEEQIKIKKKLRM